MSLNPVFSSAFKECCDAASVAAAAVRLGGAPVASQPVKIEDTSSFKGSVKGSLFSLKAGVDGRAAGTFAVTGLSRTVVAGKLEVSFQGSFFLLQFANSAKFGRIWPNLAGLAN